MLGNPELERALLEQTYDGVMTVTGTSKQEVGGETVVTPDAKAYIPLGELIDVDKEKTRLEKEIATLTADLARVDQKLSNEGFVKKAPEKVVTEERDRRTKLASQLENANRALRDLEKL